VLAGEFSDLLLDDRPRGAENELLRRVDHGRKLRERGIDELDRGRLSRAEGDVLFRGSWLVEPANRGRDEAKDHGERHDPNLNLIHGEPRDQREHQEHDQRSERGERRVFLCRQFGFFGRLHRRERDVFGGFVACGGVLRDLAEGAHDGFRFGPLRCGEERLGGTARLEKVLDFADPPLEHGELLGVVVAVLLEATDRLVVLKDLPRSV
ncbi:hypothetical protein OUZ56_032624, partial [Daphnia magna]